MQGYSRDSEGTAPEEPRELREARRELAGEDRSLDELGKKELQEVEQEAVDRIFGSGVYSIPLDLQSEVPDNRSHHISRYQGEGYASD